MPGPNAVSIELTAAERDVLRGWAREGAREGASSQSLAMRSRIVLACAEGATNAQVAADLGVSRGMVAKWRNRFAADRLDGLSDEPRPGRPRLVTDAQVEELIARTLEGDPPDGATHWTTRSMAKASGLSQSTVSRMWRAFGLKPHLAETGQPWADPLSVGRVRDVVGVHLDPPEMAIVLCVDENPQVAALEGRAPTLPDIPERTPLDQVRQDPVGLFAALGPPSGPVIGRTARLRRDQEFVRFLRLVDSSVPTGSDLHLVLDNQAVGRVRAVRDWLLRHPRFRPHFTPTPVLWMNLVEHWLAELTARRPPRWADRSVVDLESDIRAWVIAWNKDPKAFVWTRSTAGIHESPADYRQQINDSEQ
ncbi:transposase [Frankia sp. EI5c]|uniref:IS630 family transposase n=1 Tax=Frankia sp. EI5c TaxID=683316 RepID=UPI0007C3C85F|nr:IS630 family transposase [Frankia sp. EI5c]OAA22293.1 transposase [Frankia sp. EI5c]